MLSKYFLNLCVRFWAPIKLELNSQSFILDSTLSFEIPGSLSVGQTKAKKEKMLRLKCPLTLFCSLLLLKNGNAPPLTTNLFLCLPLQLN